MTTFIWFACFAFSLVKQQLDAELDATRGSRRTDGSDSFSGSVPMSRNGTARAKALSLAEIDLRLSGFRGLGDCLLHESLEDRRIDCDSGIDDQFHFPNAAVGRQ